MQIPSGNKQTVFFSLASQAIFSQVKIMNKLVLALIFSSIGTAASATTCVYYGNCPTPNTSTSSSTSNGGSSHSNATGGNSSSNSAVVGSGNSSARGGSVRNSGNSKNTNTNRQRQSQNQAQIARGGKATGGAGGTGIGGAGGAGGTGVGSQGQSTYVDSHVEATKRAAASAYAAPLTSSNDTCMGSTSAGIQAPGFGISGGSTWTDKNCVMLKNSREMWNMGLKEAALARLCMDDLNKEAIELSGITCPTRKKTSDASSGPSMTSGSSGGEYTGNDNIIRKRLGLPLVKE